MPVYFFVDPVSKAKMIADNGTEEVATITWDWAKECFIVRSNTYNGTFSTLEEAKAFVMSEEA